MRGIPASGVIIFVLVIALIEFIAYLGIIQLVSGKSARKFVTVIYAAVSVSFLVVWLSAFLNPEKIRETANYSFFYFVISLTILNLFPKGLIALFTILGLPLRLLREKYYSKLVVLSGLIIGLGLLLSVAYGISIGKETLQVNEVSLTVPSLPSKLDNLKMVQISDIHLGSFTNNHLVAQAAKKINSIQPDLLLFTGDMVNNYYQEMNGFENALATMQGRFGKFAIFGNHDYGDYSNWKTPEEKVTNHQEVSDNIRKAGFNLLQNQSAKVCINDPCLYIVGVENWGHKPFPQYADMHEALKNVPESSFKILLSHDPAHWSDQVVPNTDIPLTLAGHTHGGQLGIKIGGISFSPMYLIQPLWAGLYEKNGQFLYVNQGFGAVGFPGRIDMNPEITVITLHSNSSEIN